MSDYEVIFIILFQYEDDDHEDNNNKVNQYREMKSSKKGNEKGIVNDHYDDVEDVESDDNLAENKDIKDKLKDNKFLEDDIPAQKAFAKIPLPKFDTSVFSKLESNNEYKYLFTFMNRYQPVEIDLDTKLNHSFQIIFQLLEKLILLLK